MPKEEKIEEIIPSHVKAREITDEMKEAYLDYAMSVIISRALPDVRDGLKPVHRRILYAMMEDGLRYNTKFRKSAAVIGSVLARYHPHGDSAVYDALVRMAQDFSLRYPLVQGQGNFGCFTKDTEVKLIDGRDLSFGDLIKEQKQGQKHWTLAFNGKTKKIEIAEIRKPRLTKRKQNLIEVSLDNGEKIKCTLDHRFMLRDGNYIEAQDLKTGDSLMPLYAQVYDGEEDKNLKGYEMAYQPIQNEWVFVHHLADEWNLANGVYEKSAGKIRHHLDFNKLNNNPNNILRIQWKNHWKYHKEITSSRHKNNPDYVKKIAEMRNIFWSNPENREIYSKRMRERNIKNWQNKKYREKMVVFLSEVNKQYHKDHPELALEYSKRATATLKKLWKISAYRQLFHEKIVASNKRRTTNLTGKKKFLRICKYLITHKLPINKENFEKIRKDVFKIKSFTSWDLGIKKYYDHNLKSLFSEMNSTYVNHKVAKTRVLRKKEDVYDLTVDGLHNFALSAGVFVHNSIDGDNAAAYRYTESRLSRIGEIMLDDINKETVDFIDNYDGTKQEPTVLPSPIPQLLLNGSLGIAVGMATNIPPHNLTEIIDALTHLIDKPDSTTEDLLEFIKGPDFPTGGEIFNKVEIAQAYAQGKGPIVVRGKAEIVDSKKTKLSQIIITEIPYQVQKSTLVERFAELVQDKKIKGIKDIRDESDKDGMRIAIDLQKGANAKKILNRLYKHTDLQRKFHLNMIALVDGIQPKVLSLVEFLNYFLEHRKEIIIRRTQFDLKKAGERAHILEGLVKCLSHIDEVIKIIKQSDDRQDAHQKLMKRFKLSDIQTEAILETKLSALAKLERGKIENELKEIKALIDSLTKTLKSPAKILAVIKKELEAIKQEFGDARKTKVNNQKIGEFKLEDLIPQEQTIITLTQGGYIKRVKPSTYKTQHRGGKGILGMQTVGEDVIDKFFLANTHDSLLFFTDFGKVFQVPAYEIPEGTRVSKGRGLLNFLELSSQEQVLSVFALPKEKKDMEGKCLVMATKDGTIKKTPLSQLVNVRRNGLRAISLKAGDLLKQVEMAYEKDDVILVTRKGQSIRFSAKDVRSMGRSASGVRGIRIKKGDEVVNMDVIRSDDKKSKRYLLVIMENGYGKRSDIAEYRPQGRGGSGIKAANITAKTGDIAAVRLLLEEKDLIVISQKAQVIRTKIDQISKLSRPTQGVRIMKMQKGDKVVSILCI